MTYRPITKDGTYSKLIDSGIKLFGSLGYEAVSIRQVTQHAGANVASVCYHFGGKKKFYEEVVRYLTEELHNFMDAFDTSKLESMHIDEAKLVIIDLIRRYQNNFISDFGLNRLNIFMHEAFLHGSTETRDMHTNIMKHIHEFFTKIFVIYFSKTGKDPEWVTFSIALIHGIIQAYVITNKTIAPSKSKLNHNVLEQSIQVLLD